MKLHASFVLQPGRGAPWVALGFATLAMALTLAAFFLLVARTWLAR